MCSTKEPSDRVVINQILKYQNKKGNQKGIWAVNVEYSYKQVFRMEELYLWHT